MKRTISLIILFAVAATLAAQPVSQNDDGGKPKPRAVLGSLVDTCESCSKYSVQEILSDPVIHVIIGDSSEIDESWTVVSFQVVIITKGYEQVPISCQGNTLCEKAKEAIRNSPAGSVVYFQGVRASSKEGMRMLDDFVFRIK